MSFFSKVIKLHAPVDGELIRLEDVNDEMFAGKILGDGFAIEPSSKLIKCPIDGKVVMVSENGYAFGIEGKKGLEVLVHVGIDTVNLNGSGFKTLIEEGQNVKAGDLAIELDLDYLHKSGYPLTTMTVITSEHSIKEIDRFNVEVLAGDIITTI